jgi:4-hydroxyphenylpyruvate dioxygenase-like putative hemolysin
MAKSEEPAETRPARAYRKIDHIAIAVRDLEDGIRFFTEVLGFRLIRRLKVNGSKTGMISAELEQNGIKFVLCQGTEPESQVSRLIANYGPGVGHIALEVENVESTVDALRDHGVRFDTTVINGPGLKQAFSTRDKNSGLSFEFIQRTGEEGFLEENVRQLFEQLEKGDSY